MPKQVGVWIRVSTEDQASGESPEHHESRARMYAEVKDWQVATVYDLSGVSGKGVWDHPEAKRMREDVKEGRITGLIFSKLARLARNTRELLDFSDFFRKQGADLVSLGESIDTSSPAGRLFYTLIAAMAEWEREEIAERVRAAVPVRAKLGKPTGGQPPYGYHWSNEGLVPHPDEAPVRRLMFELFLKDTRIKAVVRSLNEAGHRTRRGGKWTDTSVRRLLKDTTAKGIHRANYTSSLGEGSGWELKPEEEWVLNEVEPVVSEETWERVNAILEERRRKYSKRPKKRARHLFGGRVVCTCGAKMNVPSGSRKYTCKDCRSKIPADDLEEIFVEELRSFVLSPERISRYLDEAAGQAREKSELLSTLQKSRQEVSQEMEKLYRLYLEDEISPRQFGEKNRPLERRLEELDSEIPRLQGEVDALKVEEISRTEIAQEGVGLASRWKELSRDEKVKIVEAVVREITVGEGEIVFDLAYLPFDPDLATLGQRNLPFVTAPPGASSGLRGGANHELLRTVRTTSLASSTPVPRCRWTALAGGSWRQRCRPGVPARP